MKQDHKASEGVVATPRSGEGNLGMRKHYACQLSFLIRGGRYVFSQGY